MTQQEIEALKGRLGDSYMDTLGASLHCDLVDALERLEKLEAAVAWHGFDEVPDKDSGVEVVDVDKCIMPFGFNGKNFEEDDTGKLRLPSEMKKHGFTGWRYPVEDLSEEIESKVQSKQNAVEAQLEDALISGRIPFLSEEGIVPGSLRIAKGGNQ